MRPSPTKPEEVAAIPLLPEKINPREFSLLPKQPRKFLLQKGDEILLETRNGTHIGTLLCGKDHQGNEEILLQDHRQTTDHQNLKSLKTGQNVVLGRNFWAPKTRLEVITSTDPAIQDDDEEPASVGYKTIPIPWAPGAKKKIAPGLKDRHLKVNFLHTEEGYEITLEDLDTKNGTCGLFTRGENIAETDQNRESLLSCVEKGEISSKDGRQAAYTEQGSRNTNQDAALLGRNFNALTDGNYPHGHIAARRTLNVISKAAAKGKFSVKSCIYKADKALIKLTKAGLNGGTTLVIAKTTTNSKGKRFLEIGHVGDSRIYVVSLSQGELLHMTRDDSQIQEYIENKCRQENDRYQESIECCTITNCLPLFRPTAEKWPYQELPPIPPTIKKIPITSLPADTLVIQVSDGISTFVSPFEILKLALQYRHLCGPEIMALARSRHDQPAGFDLEIEEGIIFHSSKTGGDNRTVVTNLI